MATEGDRGDIHFPPGQRREKPTFEPPPWEKKQFEELSKRIQEEAQQVAEEAPAPPEPQRPAEAPVEAVEPQATAEGPAADRPAQDKSEDRPQLDEKQLELLMMGLRAEEPEPEVTYHAVAIASGAMIALIGVLLSTWAVVGVTSLKEGNTAEWFFVLVLLIFGVAFMGGGGWLVFRALRQRGVL